MVLLLLATLGSGLGCRWGRLSPERMRTIGPTISAHAPRIRPLALAQKPKAGVPQLVRTINYSREKKTERLTQAAAQSRRLANSGRRETNNSECWSNTLPRLTLVSWCSPTANHALSPLTLQSVWCLPACVRQRIIYPRTPPFSLSHP